MKERSLPFFTLVPISCHVSTALGGAVPTLATVELIMPYSPLSPGAVILVSLVNPRTKLPRQRPCVPYLSQLLGIAPHLGKGTKISCVPTVCQAVAVGPGHTLTYEPCLADRGSLTRLLSNSYQVQGRGFTSSSACP